MMSSDDELRRRIEYQDKFLDIALTGGAIIMAAIAICAIGVLVMLAAMPGVCHG